MPDQKRKRRDLIREFVDLNGLTTFSTKGIAGTPRRAYPEFPSALERNGGNVTGWVPRGPAQPAKPKIRTAPDRGSVDKKRRRVV